MLLDIDGSAIQGVKESLMSRRKYVSMVMILLMMASMLVGCGGQSAGGNETANTEVVEEQQGIDYMVLVNKENKLPDTWEDELEITTITNSVGDEVQVETAAYEAYLKLKEDVEKELADRKVELQLDSAYRSVEAQQQIWDDFTEKYGDEYTKTYVAVPGYSEHHTGLALDLYFIVDGKEVYENEDLVQYPEIWEVIHAKLDNYGFILRYLEGKEEVTGYGYEQWHIRYVESPEIAKEIMDKGIVLEEYLNKLPGEDVYDEVA